MSPATASVATDHRIRRGRSPVAASGWPTAGSLTAGVSDPAPGAASADRMGSAAVSGWGRPAGRASAGCPPEGCPALSGVVGPVPVMACSWGWGCR
ncbi:hypothetical protein ACFFX0_16165 [Citricoccus parietis]|uniref:Uncharacterized protein n=1 Tax=Citricoccus parietis TaxID=592307 RepID=A0ABV5G138_9MICC